MAGDLQRDGVKFCRSIFDTVRKMSADGLGVTRQGYSSTESEVLDYLKMIGQELGLEINTDLAGNVWMCLPGKNRELPAFVAGSPPPPSQLMSRPSAYSSLMQIMVSQPSGLNEASDRRKPMGFLTSSSSTGVPFTVMTSPRPNAGVTSPAVSIMACVRFS